MTIDQFLASLNAPDPPRGLAGPLVALWHDGRGQWERAHQLAQDLQHADAHWVHAYLHRKEGDHANAQYWYGRAGRGVSTAPLEREWRAIAEALLDPERGAPDSV